MFWLDLDWFSFVIGMGVAAALGFVFEYFKEWHDGRRPRPWLVEGYALEPAHVSDFLVNNYGFRTLAECHRMATTLGAAAEPFMEAVNKALADIAIGNAGQAFLFRVVRRP
jgi:hypothetical protein